VGVMRLIESESEIIKNIRSLDRLRATNAKDKKLYARLIKNGKVFVAARFSARWLFAPSRFAGYKNNGPNHETISSRDGRVTNRRITEVLGPYIDSDDPRYAAIDHAFLDACAHSGIEPSKHHLLRRYWVVDQERVAEDGDPSATTAQDIIALNQRTDLTPTHRRQLILARIGQGKFRHDLLRYWKACAVTGYKLPTVLRASHIKPWRECNDAERLNPANGLLLLATLDALFDKGLITFKNSGSMLVSSSLTRSDRETLGLYGELRIKPGADQKKFLKMHRQKNGFE